MRELLTAIGLTGSFNAEIELRVRLGLPIIEPLIFLKSACPCWLTPEQFMHAMQAGVVFSQPPPEVLATLVRSDGRQNGGGLGRDHRVGGGAQRIYPLRGQPK